MLVPVGGAVKSARAWRRPCSGHRLHCIILTLFAWLFPDGKRYATYAGIPRSFAAGSAQGLFGESGGGAKIATLMGMPTARGLFHRAATMSGQQVTASGPLNATSRARTFLDALQLPVERVEELRTLAKERLLEALGATDPVVGKGSLYFGPVLDERTLQQHPFYPEAPVISAQSQ